jgi:hypothetical protein
MKWNVGVVPAELSGLTVLEQLLITRWFHIVHVVTVHGSVGGGNLWFSSHTKPFFATQSWLSCPGPPSF